MLLKQLKGLDNRLASALNRLASALALYAPTERHLSKREAEMLLAPYVAKQKLGRSFFTKRVPKHVRYKRVQTLTPLERTIARDRGWI